VQSVIKRQHSRHQHQGHQDGIDVFIFVELLDKRNADEHHHQRDQEFRHRIAVEADAPGCGALGFQWLWRNHDSIIHRQ
jgi:hypothetical protein